MEIRETLEVSAMACACGQPNCCSTEACACGQPQCCSTEACACRNKFPSLTCPTVWTVVREKETGRGFTEFRRLDHCPEKDLWMLHKQVTPQDVTDTTKMSQTCGYVGNEKTPPGLWWLRVGLGSQSSPKDQKNPHVIASRSGPLSLHDRSLT